MSGYLLAMSLVLPDVWDSSLTTVSTASALECVRMCYTDLNCSSVFYHREYKQCGISPQVYSTGSSVLSSSNGMQLFSWDTSDCPTLDGWIYHRQSNLCYKRSTYKTSITAAETSCSENGGRLVVVDTAEKNSHLLTMHPTSAQRSWIGLQRSNGEWKWSNGQTLGPFIAWKNQHPENGKDCGVMSGYLQGWTSFDCPNDPNVNFICERVVDVYAHEACN